MNIHTMEFVFICQERNFAAFEVPMPSTTRLRRVLETNAAKAAEATEAAEMAEADNARAPAKKKQRVGDTCEKVSGKRHKRGGGGSGGRMHTTQSQKERDAIIFRKVCYEIGNQDTTWK
jgi:hypothetical protein